MCSPTGGASCAEDDDLSLDTAEMVALGNKVRRVTCSEPWYRHCVRAVVRGDVAYKPDQAKELRRKRVYPPGGGESAMVRCCFCRHWAPAARLTRNEWVEKLPGGQVRRCHDDWRPVCVDCYFCSLPIEVVVHVPTSPGFSTRIKDTDVAAHLGATTGADGKPTGNILRRRYLADDGTVREPFTGDDGFKYEAVMEVVGTPAAAGKAA